MYFDPDMIYGQLAEALYKQELSTADVHLPPMPTHPESFLQGMATELTLLCPSHPGRAWGGALVMKLVAQQANRPFWEGQAAVYQSWAANLWVNLEYAQEAADEAETLLLQHNHPQWKNVAVWLRNAQPWMMNPETALEALEPLEYSWPDDRNGRDWFHHFLFSLAWAYLLCSQIEDALEAVTKIEAHCQTLDDPICLARIPFLRAAIRRNQGQYHLALEYYQQAAEQIARTNGTAFATRIWCGYGYALRQGTNRFTETIEALTQAAALAKAADIPYWQGMAENAQIQVYRFQGQLHKAVELARQARAWFARNQGVAGLIESLIDSSTIYEELGQYQIAYDYITEGMLLQNQHETHTLQRLTLQMYAGVLEWRLGKYQLALRRLEDAQRTAVKTDFSARAAEISIYLAHIWHDLDEIKRVEESYLVASQLVAELDNVYLQYNLITLESALQMAAPFDQSLVDNLERHIAFMADKDSPLYLAQLRKLQAIAMIQLGQFDEAYVRLEHSLHSFRQMGVISGQAESQLWIGYIHTQRGNSTQAYKAWQKVIMLATQQPQTRWQAHVELARLMTQDGREQSEIVSHYEHAIAALSSIRHMISQPALLSQMLLDAERIIYEAVSFVSLMTAERALLLLEMSKAYTLAVQLRQDALISQEKFPEEIQTIRLKLFELQQELAQENNRITRIRRQRNWFQLIEQYDQLQAEYERSQQFLPMTLSQTADFQLSQFRQQAASSWHDNWLALDYFLYDDTLITLVVSSENVWVEQSSIATLPALLALLDDPAMITEAYLHQLAQMLLPQSVQERLTAETVLLIAPYGRLHNLPWSALFINERPLVTQCQPLIIPALHLFSALDGTPTTLHTGLLTAVAEFPARSYTPLPFTLDEAGLLQHISDSSSEWFHWQTQLQQGATWQALQTVRDSEQWETFDCWHVATHAFFSEQANARACGIALYDQDIWLDDLARLAPFPALVTLSTCSGLPAKIFPGDDHAGLAATCLAAGSKNVVGSLWKMRDDISQEIFVSFYQLMQEEGASPLGALTQIQRQMIAAERPFPEWGGLRVSGRGN